VPVILAEKRTLVSVNGPYPVDSRILERTLGSEGLCCLSAYDIDLITDQQDIAPVDLRGKTMGIKRGAQGTTQVPVHGHIARLQIGDHLSGQFGSSWRRMSCRLVP
jgi:uncharacterized protein involved in type VI secretion and phage assembly